MHPTESELSHNPMNKEYEDVIRANQDLHTVLASQYNETEPHFRPENVAHVEHQIKGLCAATNAKRLLDLGCGTGFMIQIAKPYVPTIDGIDATQAMLDRVEQSGTCSITLHRADTGTFAVNEGAYDLVTAYSFLHHLYDIRPTLATAAKALRPGGKFYADLDPNFYFWQAIHQLTPNFAYDPLLAREIASVTQKDEEIEARFHVSRDVFNRAEYNKNITGGFREEDLIRDLSNAGFREVQIQYYWALGQAAIVNGPAGDPVRNRETATVFMATLQRGLPLTRHLFKYIGFVATR